MGQWIEGFQLVSVDSSDNRYKWIQKKMSSTIVSHNDVKIGGYDIVEVFQIKNSTLWKNYTARRKVISDEMGGEKVTELRLFHGTQKAEIIAQEGFKVGLANENGLLGKGIFFADLSTKSNMYTLGGWSSSCQPHRSINCDTCFRWMLVCKVAIGKEYHAKGHMSGTLKPPDGYHCVVGDPSVCSSFNLKEYAVYNNSQAYPGHLVKYRVCL